jgi:hypothetical protein
MSRAVMMTSSSTARVAPVVARALAARRAVAVRRALVALVALVARRRALVARAAQRVRPARVVWQERAARRAPAVRAVSIPMLAHPMRVTTAASLLRTTKFPNGFPEESQEAEKNGKDIRRERRAHGTSSYEDFLSSRLPVQLLRSAPIASSSRSSVGTGGISDRGVHQRALRAAPAVALGDRLRSVSSGWLTCLRLPELSPR